MMMTSLHTNMLRIGLLLLLSIRDACGAADIEISSNVTKLAFGSCHKNKYAAAPGIWKAIAEEDPQAFLWTGDAVYPPKRGIAPLVLLEREYEQMLTNESIGYAGLKPPLGIYGTWDDHDYGGNDAGKEMSDRKQRRGLFFDFLKYPQPVQTKLESRSGMYHSIEFGDQGQKVKVLALDTRWNRDRHCIPSVSTIIPLGAAISCVSRWILAGVGGSPFCSKQTSILGEEQWKWLKTELENSSAQVHIIISSIQVLSTNPAMEGWGHFPHEQEKLLQLLNQYRPSGLMILSGDVHHAEILDPTVHASQKQSFLEITSSGLTHSCTMPFYGPVCEPLLQAFSEHRAKPLDYYLERNFGTIQVDWMTRQTKVDIKSATGSTVLTTGWRSWNIDMLSETDMQHIPRTVDGHLLPKLKYFLIGAVMIVTAIIQLFIWVAFRRPSTGEAKSRKEKIV